jgi:hypothetical protein
MKNEHTPTQKKSSSDSRDYKQRSGIGKSDFQHFVVSPDIQKVQQKKHRKIEFQKAKGKQEKRTRIITPAMPNIMARMLE